MDTTLLMIPAKQGDPMSDDPFRGFEQQAGSRLLNRSLSPNQELQIPIQTNPKDQLIAFLTNSTSAFSLENFIVQTNRFL